MIDDTKFDIEVVQGFDAPRGHVYQAFIDPDQLAQWYGPHGFPVPRDTVEIDARVGGTMRFTMVSEADPSLRTAVNAGSSFAKALTRRALRTSGGRPGR